VASTFDAFLKMTRDEQVSVIESVISDPSVLFGGDSKQMYLDSVKLISQGKFFPGEKWIKYTPYQKLILQVLFSKFSPQLTLAIEALYEWIHERTGM